MIDLRQELGGHLDDQLPELHFLDDNLTLLRRLELSLLVEGVYATKATADLITQCEHIDEHLHAFLGHFQRSFVLS